MSAQKVAHQVDLGFIREAALWQAVRESFGAEQKERGTRFLGADKPVQFTFAHVEEVSSSIPASENE
jgi:hypothetical protein